MKKSILGMIALSAAAAVALIAAAFAHAKETGPIRIRGASQPLWHF